MQSHKDQTIYHDLFNAIDNEDVETVKAIVAKGANINIFMDGKDTPLAYALRKRSVDIVSVLIENDAIIPHTEISLRLNILGCKNSLLGSCGGIAYKGMEAILALDINTFFARFFLLYEIFINDLPAEIERAKSLTVEIKDHVYPNSPPYAICRDDKAKLALIKTIIPFCHGVEIYQHLYAYPELQENERLLNKFNFSASSGLTLPVLLEKQVGITQVAIVSNVYNEKSLAGMIKILGLYFERLHLSVPIAFVISGPCNNLFHALTLGYLSETKEWVIINASKLTCKFFPHQNHQEIAKTVLSSFTQEQNIILTIEMYVTNVNHKMFLSLYQQVQLDTEWQQIHRTNFFKAQYRHTGTHFTWLMNSVIQGDKHQIKVLLAEGADPNVHDNDLTPLKYAVDQQDLETVNLLLDFNAGPNQITYKYKIVPFHPDFPVEKNQIALEISKDHLSFSYTVINVQDQKVTGTIDYEQLNIKNENEKNIGVLKGKMQDIVKIISQRGEIFEANTSPLIRAVLKKNVLIIEALLKKGADPDWENLDKKTALSIAIVADQLDLTLLLLKYGARPTLRLLLYAIKGGNLELLQAILDKNICVNQVLENGLSPLIVAIAIERIDIVKLLIAKNADVDLALTSNGITPLLFAIGISNKDIVELLIKAHANVNLPDVKGMMPIHLAAKLRLFPIINLLLDAGAKNINSPMLSHGGALLFLAAQHGEGETIKLLLDRGADMTVPYKTTRGPLIEFAKKRGEVILARMQKIIDEKLKDDLNNKDELDDNTPIELTPLQIAQIMGNDATVFLLNNQVNFRLLAISHQTPSRTTENLSPNKKHVPF